ncbi:hypothetical protein [Microvirga sp. KLBC 81]|uniref:hypothetical protein n=1 Tax=Microvirga sp. KLBC 81 TaxID=1862707 RepID=UPI001057BF2C|nr:hypothetical protein [Microvirga sp. KLBC 81]
MDLDEVRSKLVAAGIPATAIRPGKDPDYDIDILILSPTDQMLAKADRDAMAKLQIDSHYAFDFATEEQRVAFAPFVVAENARRDREAAIAVLSQDGKLDKVPRFDGREPMSAFAHRLEQFCGFEPGEALRVVDLHWLEFNNPSFGRETAVAQAEGRSIESFWCLKRVIDATGLSRHFIGNRFRNPDDAT